MTSQLQPRHLTLLPAGAALSLLLLAGCHSAHIVAVGEQTDTFVQHGQNAQSAVFAQRPGRIDILFVVDDSPSMCAKRQKLAADFSQFLAQLLTEGLDFHIGVVTTTVSGAQAGELIAAPDGTRILTNTSPNLLSDFAAIVQAVGDNGSPDSQPLLAAATALQPPLTTEADGGSGFNAGFLRSDASLAIVVIDDEDDYSLTLPPAPDAGQRVGSGTAAPGDPMVFYFDRLFKGLKGPGDENLISVSGIVGAGAGPDGGVIPDSCDVVDGGPATSCTDDDDSANAAYRILQVVADTGGLGQSICQTDFTTILENLGRLLGGLSTRFVLSTNAATGAFQASSLTVTVTAPGQPAQQIAENAQSGWQFDASTGAVEFLGSYVPPPGASIAIGYATLTNTFQLTYPAIPSSLTVTLALPGASPTTVPTAAQNAVTGYTYDVATNALVFPATNVPPLGATITATYDPQQ